MAYQWIVGDTYGGLNSAGEQAGQNASNNWFRQAQMVQGLDQQARAEADAQQQAQDTAAKWRWTQQQEAQKMALATRAQNLSEQQAKFNWAKENPVAEKAREFDISNLNDLADSGGIDSTQHAAQLAPNLPPTLHAQAAARSKAYRDAKTQVVQGLRDDADTLNEVQLGNADAETMKAANALRSDKKRMALLRQGRTGQWEPAVEQPAWLPPAKPMGDEHMTPNEMAEIERTAPSGHSWWQRPPDFATATMTNAAGGPPPMGARRPAVLPWTQPAAVPLRDVGTPQVSVNGGSIPVGKRVKQNGVIYQWTGQDWVAAE